MPLFTAGMQVFVYNHPGVEAGPSFRHKLTAAQKVFARGSAVAILEPFYKLMADGTHGVRVDNPTEVRLTRSGRHNIKIGGTAHHISRPYFGS